MRVQQDPGILGNTGYRTGITWATSSAARARAAELIAAQRAQATEIGRNAHKSHQWAAHAVRSPALLSAVQAVIGESVAVENTFLLIKWPGKVFAVPWHQDGIDAGRELDPDRSVSAWLALTDATSLNGCLRVVGGSHRCGYLPFAKEPEHGGDHGRADQVSGFSPQHSAELEIPAGGAILMDSRLIHSSGPNHSQGARIGLNIRYVAPDGWHRRDPSCPSLDPVSGPGW